ncbi:hypothetical protein B0F90DRAFT_1667895 [Multifurca ochricompacta]|uniref:DUF1996 domain-containing protein n=1 Tax=Multifurca ochricompacta TaxID=376703 RepID=A0AAD4QNU3_9AGAM|nr:hypothetical protein B0F90DRAFT_1667895 [Multifurca ochricompacta]
MIVSLFVLGLLLFPSANAFWRLPCAKPVLNARVDPIVSPGKASGHSHTIMGSGAIGFGTTFADLRNSQCTTCKVKDDKSAYWIPELYYQFKNGTFQVVGHGGMLAYYLQRGAANETVQAFPDGLRMLAGSPFLRSNTGTPESKAISWNCIDFNGPPEPQTPGFHNTRCPSGLRAQVFFPSCWDGVNLDSPDHKSHMAYPDGVDNGMCPPSHPIHLVSLFFEVYFEVAPFNALNDGGRFVLANGDPTGYGLHADFMNGWDRSVLSRAVATCKADSGVIEDCPVFKNEGRFVADADMNACSATNPLLEEKVTAGSLLRNLPGCVAVTDGPAAASAANIVQGCTPGTGVPVPISNPPSNTTSAPSSVANPSSSTTSSGTSSLLGTITIPAPTSTQTTPSLSSSLPSSSIPTTTALPTTHSEIPVTSLPSAVPSGTHDSGSHDPHPSPSSSKVSSSSSPIPSSVVSVTQAPKATKTMSVYTKKPVPSSPSSGHHGKDHGKDHGHKGGHGHGHDNKHGHGHEHEHGHKHHNEQPQQDDDLDDCDMPAPTLRPSKNASTPHAHRRHHAKRGHGSRMFI